MGGVFVHVGLNVAGNQLKRCVQKYPINRFETALKQSRKRSEPSPKPSETAPETFQKHSRSFPENSPKPSRNFSETFSKLSRNLPETFSETFLKPSRSLFLHAPVHSIMRDGCQTAPKLSVTQLHLFGEAGSDSQQFNFDTFVALTIATHIFFDTFLALAIATHVF